MLSDEGSHRISLTNHLGIGEFYNAERIADKPLLANSQNPNTRESHLLSPLLSDDSSLHHREDGGFALQLGPAGYIASLPMN